MKVVVVRDGECYEAKNLPLGMAAPMGMICDMNPNTAKNWMIPEGIVLPATEENINKVREMMKEK
ncbi:MAG: hypothetical protein Q4F83_09260 [Eubacteriales bacterium]|nr:hypothetical protein [Eubacteriales bacterium]